MNEVVRRLRVGRASGDRGVAIVAALAVVMLVGIMLAVVVDIAMSEARQTGRDRQRSSGVAVAEGAVDGAVARIQSAPPGALGAVCGNLPTSADVAADDFTVTTTVTYYNAAGAVVDCSALTTTKVAQASIVSRARSNSVNGAAPAQRTVETLLKLTPSVGLDKAIFANSTMTMSNNAKVTAQSGKPEANIYTNGDFYCLNNQEFHGSILAPKGSIYLESQCTVIVDAWAKGEIKVTNPKASIGGRALSYTSTVTLGSAALGQQARAAGQVTGNVCATSGKCFSNDPTVPAPPVEPFPELLWNATAQAAWAAEGYTNVVNIPGTYTVQKSDGSTAAVDFPCGWYTGPDLAGPPQANGTPTTLKLAGKADGAAAWLWANGWKLPGPTVLAVNCASSKVTIQENYDLQLNRDLVIVTRGGLSFTQQSIIKAVDGTATATDPALLYMIQPVMWESETVTCNGYGIELNNQVTVQNTVNTLLYSPCPIHKANNSDITGQVYSGQAVAVDNKFDMKYVPMPVPAGALNPTGAAGILSYSVDVLYKREGL